MIALNAFNIDKISDDANQAVFQIGPFPKGYGNTIGNILRRILLSSIPGSAVSAVKLKGVEHEFSTLNGLADDVLTLLLSVKNIVVISKSDETVVLKLKADGKKGQVVEVAVSDIQPNSAVEIINKDYIITKLTSDVKFEADLYITNGIGYSMPDQEVRKELGVLPIDARYSPVRLVSYEVLPTRVGQETDLDQLNLSVTTNGAITPEEALFTASDILFKMSGHLQELADSMATGKKLKPISLAKPAEEVKEEVKNAKPLPVAEMNLSTRLTNALLRSGYEDLNNLDGMTEEELANIKGMGQKSLDELIKILKKHEIKII